MGYKVWHPGRLVADNREGTFLFFFAMGAMDCLLQLDGGKWKRRQGSMQNGKMIFQEGEKEVLRVGRGDVVKREGLGLVAWPKNSACGKRQKTEVSLIVEEPGSRRQVEQWLDQLARRHQGRLLVFINPF